MIFCTMTIILRQENVIGRRYKNWNMETQESEISVVIGVPICYSRCVEIQLPFTRPAVTSPSSGSFLSVRCVTQSYEDDNEQEKATTFPGGSLGDTVAFFVFFLYKYKSCDIIYVYRLFIFLIHMSLKCGESAYRCHIYGIGTRAKRYSVFRFRLSHA